MTSPSSAQKDKMARNQTRYLAQSIRLSEAEAPGILRATILTLSLMTLVFIVWAGVSQVYEIARSPGEIIPAGQSRIIQHRDGGIVAEVLVKDGMHVTAGTPLLRIDDSEMKQDLARARARQTTLLLQEERLRAFIEERPAHFTNGGDNTDALARDQSAFLESQRQTLAQELSIIDEQIEQKQKAIRVIDGEIASMAEATRMAADLLRRREALNRDGVLSDVRLLETRQRHNDLKGQLLSRQGEKNLTQSALQELMNRRQATIASRRDEAHRELDRVLAEKAENEETIVKLATRQDGLLLTSPVDGMVQGLQSQLRGSVIQPGQPVMEIVPADAPLVVSLKIQPRDIGHLAIGQPVQVKVSSFDFSRYGAVRGRLENLSASTFQGQGGERYYEGTVHLDQPYVGRPENRVLPGMTVMADIITGKKTILAYLLKPLHTAVAGAFRER